MLVGVRRLAMAECAPPRREDRTGHDGTLFFDSGGPRWPTEAAEPSRRPPSAQATFWSWAAVVVLVASLVLPFSLTALVDLIRYLSR